MAATSAEAAALDAAMGRVNRSFDENQRKTTATAEAIVRARGEVDLLRREYQRYQNEYERGEQKVSEARQRASDVLRDQRDDLNAVREAHNALRQAESEAEQLRGRAIESYERYHAKLTAVRIEVERFNQAHVEATRGFRNMSREAEKMGAALESITEKLSTVARLLGQAGLAGLFGGAAAGSLFASGAGGLNLLAGAMAVVVEVAEDFVGVMALLPAAIQGAVLAFGTLAVALHGVGEALGSLEDPKKFIESIKDMSPAMQQVMLTVQSFTESFRGVREVLQESFATQFVQDIQPLITTWLPQLMRAGQSIATEWGQAFHQVFQFFQTPEASQGFQLFVNNLVTGFQAARGAIQPLLSAWTTLATVGSQVFPRLGAAISHVAEVFNNWIQQKADSGELLAFINRALDSITTIGHVIRDVAIGVHNIFEIFRGGGGSAIDTLAGISAEFRSWTESIGGQQQIANFFNLIQAAARAVAPQIHLLGEGIAVIAGTLTRLGIAIQPGLNSFFTSFVEALRNLSPYVVQLAPAINQFLAAFGQTLVQIITTLGPRLPGFFQDMSDAFVQIMQVLPPLVDLFARLLSHLTAGDVEAILGLVVAFKALSGTIGVLNVVLDANPFVLIAGAIALVAAGTVILITHWDQVKEKANELTSRFGGLSGILARLKRDWDTATGAVANFFRTLGGQIAGGWDVLVNGLSNLTSNITNWFENVDWSGIGVNIVNGILNGIVSMFGRAGDVASNLVQVIRDHLPSSPAKRGPFSQQSPEQLGAMMVTQYAGGMATGIPSVTDASASVAGAASGIGTGGGGGGAGFGSFSSAGQAGQSGRDFSTGKSGFDQWVNFITKDLTAWNNIAQEAFGLVDSVSKIVVNTIKVAASIWGGGDNPLTRPGGIAGPPGTAQQSIFGVPMKPIPGKAPIPELAPLGGPHTDTQQTIPGVPTKALPGTGGVPPANPPATTTGQAPAGPQGPVPVPFPNVEGTSGTGQFSIPPGAPGAPAPPPGAAAPAPGDTPLVAALKANGSFSPAQIRLIQGFAEVEGPGSVPGVPSLGFVDAEIGSTTLQGHVDRLAKQFRDRASVAGPFPEGGTDQEQAQWMARVVGQTGKVDYHGDQQPADYVQRVVTAMQGIGAAPPPAAPGQPGRAPDLGPRSFPNEQTPASGGPVPIPDLQDLSKFFNVEGTTYRGHQTDERGNLGVDWWPRDATHDMSGQSYTKEQADQLTSYAKWLGTQPGVEQVIWENPFTGEKVGYYKGEQVGPGTDQPGYYRDDWSGHTGHVHTRMAEEIGPPPTTAPLPSATDLSGAAGGVQVPGLPRGEGGVTRGGLHIPSDAATYAIGGVGALGATAAVVKAQRFFSNLKWNSKLADLELEMFRNGGDMDAAIDKIMGIPPDAKAAAPDLYGALRDNIGSAVLSESGPGTLPGATGARGDAALRNLVRAGRITPGQAAAINPNLMIDVYHATDEPGARSILEGGFQRQAGTKGDAYFSPDIRNARVNARIYGPNVLQGQIPVSAADPNFAGGVRVPFENLQGVQFRQLTPDELGVTDLITPRNIPAAPPTGFASHQEMFDALGRQPATTTGADPASVAGDVSPAAARGGLSRGLGIAGRVAGPALSLANAGLIGYGAVSESVAEVQRRNLAANRAAAQQGTVLGIPALGPSFPAPALQPVVRPITPADVAAARPTVDPHTVATAGQPLSSLQPSIFGPAAAPATVTGDQGPQPGAQAERRGVTPRTIFGAAQATPVHITNPQELPGGIAAPPIKTPEVRPTGVERPLGTPQPGQPGFVGPVDPRTLPARDQGPQPGAQRQRTTDQPLVGQAAGEAGLVTPGAVGDIQKPSSDTRSPLTKFEDTMASVGSIAGDAFTVFQDVIESIGAAANITDTLVRGFANTEDVVGFIRQFQTFIKTGADIAKLVGDVGGAIGGAGAGDPTGMTGAIGGAISAISGIVESALTATNAAISLGIDIYHEVGKYAGFIFGEFLGGAATGPLGGNVRMLLNTRTNQLQTYSEDNPLNKNTFEVPLWQRSYQQQATPPALPPQVNIYAGPGQTPQEMMAESMWLASTGAPAVASVAGQD